MVEYQYKVVALEWTRHDGRHQESVRDEFQATVEEMLNDGWNLAGGITVRQFSDGHEYLQAVYRGACL